MMSARDELSAILATLRAKKSVKNDEAVRDALDLADDDLGAAAYNLGARLWGLDHYDAAIASFRLAIANDDDEARAALPEALAWLGQWDEAEPRLRELADQGDDRAAGLLGEYLAERPGHADLAIALLRRGLRSEGRLVTPLVALLVKANSKAAALSVLEEQTALKNRAAPILLGNLLAEEGKRDAAIAAYEAGIDLQDAHSAFNLAVLYHNLGNDSAAAHFRALAKAMGDERA